MDIGDIKILSLWSLLLVTFLLLPSCAGFRVAEPPSAKTVVHRVTHVTRVLKNLPGYAYVETVEHSATLSDPVLIDFFGRHPGLNGKITRSDYLFLLELSRDQRLRTLLTSVPDSSLEHGLDYRASTLKTKLTTISHVASDATRRGAYSEDAVQIDLTNTVDRIKIALLLKSLVCVDFRRKLAEILVADIRDSSAEYGGALVLSTQPDCPLWMHQLSSLRFGDHEYRPPAELYSSGCVAIWHNHATAEESANPFDVDNSPLAGPSGTLRGSLVQVGGDMWQCYIHGIDAVIVTPVGRGDFNLDFVSSEGIVIDLGIYYYPDF